MHLLVGLGNPGASYALHRHNVGFMAVEAIGRHFAFEAPKQKFHGLLREGRIGGERCLILEPQTYMNLSGVSVGEAVRFLKIPTEQVIVFHDELALDFGRCRMKLGGGHAGHNGLKSIDAHIGKEYWRLRIGIGHPGDKERVTSHVLGNFSKEEQATLPDLLDAFCRHTGLLMTGEMDAFMSKVHKDLPSPVTGA